MQRSYENFREAVEEGLSISFRVPVISSATHGASFSSICFIRKHAADLFINGMEVVMVDYHWRPFQDVRFYFFHDKQDEKFLSAGTPIHSHTSPLRLWSRDLGVGGGGQPPEWDSFGTLLPQGSVDRHDSVLRLGVCLRGLPQLETAKTSSDKGPAHAPLVPFITRRFLQ
ncbi:hypothetical protein BJV77DRAFT_624975 [Russula vinacea]|nr:hypothetical protein BJV77DRAFT_624975 [Russula vinacea]